MSLKNRTNALCLLLSSGCAAFFVSGCSSFDEHLNTPDFGDSVRHTIMLQTDNAAAGGNGLDGVKAQRALAAYRADVAEPKKAERDIVLSVGN